MEPIDYTRDVLSPLQGYMQGLQFGEGIVSARQARDEAKQAMGLRMAEESRAAEVFSMQKAAAEKAKVDAERGQAELARLAGLGAGATDQDFLRTWIANPAIRDDLTSLQTTMSAPKIATMTTTAQNLYAAASQGNAEAVRGLLSEQLAAAENTGDQTMIPMLRASLDQLDADPQAAMGALRSSTGLTLMGLKGPEYLKQMNEVLNLEAPKMTEAARTQDQLLRNAGIVPLSEGGDGRYEAATAEKAGVPGGENVDTFDLERKVREEYTKLTRDYDTVAQAHDRVLASQDTGPGDIALIFNYMKMLDPGSTVREGEFATAQNSGGIPTAISNMYNNAISGERLSPDQRNGFKSQAADLFGAAKKIEASARARLSPVVRKYKLDPVNVFGGQPQEVATDEGASVDAGSTPQSFLTNDGVIAAAKNAGVTPEQMWAIMSPEMRAQYGR